MTGKESLWECVRQGLRASYRNGFCPRCGAADPDDDGHRPECVIGTGFESLNELERDYEIALEEVASNAGV